MEQSHSWGVLVRKPEGRRQLRKEDIIKMNLQKLGRRQVAGSCEWGDKPSGFTQCDKVQVPPPPPKKNFFYIFILVKNFFIVLDFSN